MFCCYSIDKSMESFKTQERTGCDVFKCTFVHSNELKFKIKYYLKWDHKILAMYIKQKITSLWHKSSNCGVVVICQQTIFTKWDFKIHHLPRNLTLRQWFQREMLFPCETTSSQHCFQPATNSINNNENDKILVIDVIHQPIQEPYL